MKKHAGAIALSGDSKDYAPRIAARGERAQAERILALAREAGVPIVEDAELLELLSVSGPGDYIPFECWEAVAAVLAFVRRCSFSPERSTAFPERERL